jgi:hypothetical protein
MAHHHWRIAIMAREERTEEYMSSVKTTSYQSLLTALDQGELTQEQLRSLIALEAERLGLTVDEAIDRAHRNTLPQNPQGFDLQFHILMLAA